MLDGTADATGNIDLGTNGDTGLTNLQVVSGKAGIHSGTAGTYLGMKHFGQFVQLVETFFRAYTVTARNDDAGALQVILGSLYMTVEHLGDVLRLRHELSHVLDDDLALVVGVENLSFHHAAADSCHLRTVLGVHNGGYDITTKSGTNLIEQVIVVFAGLLVVVRPNLQRCAVGSKTAVQCRRDTRAEITAYHIGTHQTNLRLLLLEKIYQYGRVRLAGIG